MKSRTENPDCQKIFIQMHIFLCRPLKKIKMPRWDILILSWLGQLGASIHNNKN